jgi:hypothetical protein
MGNEVRYYYVDASIDCWEVETYGMIYEGKLTTVTRIADIEAGTETYSLSKDKEYNEKDMAFLYEPEFNSNLEQFNQHCQAAIYYLQGQA